MRKHEIARITTMLLFVMLSALTAFAQNITVKGVISDGQINEPLMGVTVREKATIQMVLFQTLTETTASV